MQGLRQYFQLCNNSEGIAVATPSRVVDAAWHEFILMTRSYEQFCIKAFDRFLHHMPARDEQTSNVISNGMMNASRQTCEWEQIKLAQPARLPFLFVIDSALQIPDGFMHSLTNHYGIDHEAEEKERLRRVCEGSCAAYYVCEACPAPDDK